LTTCISEYRDYKRESRKHWFVTIILILIITRFIFPIGNASETGIFSKNNEDEIYQLVTEEDIPSLHICIVTGNEIAWVKGYGDQINPDTVFLIGSIQKMFVAISILQLYENGKIELDDNVNEYINLNLEHPDYPNTPITIRMLLSHRSGLDSTLPSEFCYDWEGLNYPDYRGYYNPDIIGIPLGEYLSLCISPSGSLYSRSNWLHEPGTLYGYSNNGYKVLMHILEKVSNQTISEYMQVNIFGPLRMNNTGFDASDFTEHHAIPHTRTRGNSTNKELPVWNGRYMLRSTVSDMGHLLIALMNEGRFDSHQILQRDTVALMFENNDSMSLRSRLRSLLPIKDFLWVGYGLGIEVRNNGILGHGGSTVGFTAECYLNPKTKIGYVRLSNVNAILDYTSNEWQDINKVTDKICTKVFLKIGLLPTVDIFLIMIIITLGSSIMIIRSLYLRRSRRG
jgi:CubicO group peptidase (beta-lactamase class C family)